MKDPDKKTGKKKRSLSAAARDKRETAPRRPAKRGDKTSLNLSGPEGDASASSPPDALGEALVERGLITRHQLFNALNESYNSDITLREALVSLGFIDEDTLREVDV